MGLREGDWPQEAALLLLFEFACGFRASLGCAVDLPSGLFLGAIFMLPGSLRSGALDRKRAIRPYVRNKGSRKVVTLVYPQFSLYFNGLGTGLRARFSICVI